LLAAKVRVDARRVRGAVMIEHALILPLLVVAAVAALCYSLYVVTEFALEGDVSRVVERAVRIAPNTGAGGYCQALEAFVRGAFDTEEPFYTAYVSNLRITRVAVTALAESSDQRLLTVRREGEFGLLNSQAWGLPVAVAAHASALLPRAAQTGNCRLAS
jgi:Flp pilus assembly protein TadG